MEEFGPIKSTMGDIVEVLCRNCGRRRRAVWVVARMLPRNEEGAYVTEVCHSCLNERRPGRETIRARTS